MSPTCKCHYSATGRKRSESWMATVSLDGVIANTCVVIMQEVPLFLGKTPEVLREWDMSATYSKWFRRKLITHTHTQEFR